MYVVYLYITSIEGLFQIISVREITFGPPFFTSGIEKSFHEAGPCYTTCDTGVSRLRWEIPGQHLVTHPVTPTRTSVIKKPAKIPRQENKIVQRSPGVAAPVLVERETVGSAKVIGGQM